MRVTGPGLAPGNERRAMSKPSRRVGYTRRRFLQTVAGAGAALVPLYIPGRALGLADVAAPSERITLGGIGIRHRGGYVLRHMLQQPDVHFLAVCDVRADQRRTVKATWQGAIWLDRRRCMAAVFR